MFYMRVLICDSHNGSDFKNTEEHYLPLAFTGSMRYDMLMLFYNIRQ